MKNFIKIFSEQIILPGSEINHFKHSFKIGVTKNILIYLNLWTEGRRNALYKAINFYSHLGLTQTVLFNPLNAELKPVCHLLALVGAHHSLHVSREKGLVIGWKTACNGLVEKLTEHFPSVALWFYR